MAIKDFIGTDGNYNANANWSPANVPVNGDTVRLRAGRSSITSGLAQSAVALAAFIVEEGYTGTIASSSAYLEITTSRFEFNGGAESWIDLKASAMAPQVFGTSSPATGKRGLYLLGSALTTLNVTGGSVGLAVNVGETSTLTTARLATQGASLWLGTGVSLTNWQQHQGTGIIRCALTTLDLYDGTLTTQEVGAIATVTIKGGTFIPNSTGTITTLNSYGGKVDFRQSDAARAVTTLNKYLGGAINFNKEAVTVTNWAVLESQYLNGTAA